MLALGLAMAACSSPGPGASPPAAGAAVVAPPASPQHPIQGPCAHACTEQYDPVCASIEHNGRRYRQTYSNACWVCVPQGRVLAIEPGPCGQALPRQ
ncbi:hypothetical protein CK623_09295 [Vandammella animalimorsus]|uniref:Kazal-like domain-containing protein n=1 Tax=Vandammella animalimorsus TaxID=2029117 RepID=A0A2A2APZ4_9BURK|nr:hypothetical protein CK623_09295 [Vandammella animalimorsus]